MSKDKAKKVTLEKGEVVIDRHDLLCMLTKAYNDGMEAGDIRTGEVMDIIMENFELEED